MQNTVSKDIKEPDMSLSEKASYTIKKLMADRSVTIHELSQNINIPYPTLAQLLQGRNASPKIQNLVLIARYFKVTVDQLIGETIIQTPSKNSNNDLDSKEMTPWNEKFFIDSMTIFKNLLKEKDIPSISTEKALKIIREIYLFSIQRKEKKPDKQFAEWIVNQYF